MAYFGDLAKGITTAAKQYSQGQIPENRTVTNVFSNEISVNTRYSSIKAQSSVFYNFIKDCDFNGDDIINENELSYVEALRSNVDFDLDIDGVVTNKEMAKITNNGGNVKAITARIAQNASNTTVHEFNYYLNYAKSLGVRTDDIELLMDDINKKNYSEVVNKKYYAYFINKLNARINSQQNPDRVPETLPATKFDNLEFNQGNIGDCWFLSTIGAHANDDVNRQKLNDLVWADDPENPTTIYVQYASMDEPYEIPFETLQGANEFCDGNLYLRALEMATERFLINRGTSIDLLKTSALDGVNCPFEGGTMRYGSAILFDKEVPSTKYLDNSLVQQLLPLLNKKYNMDLSRLYEMVGLDADMSRDQYAYYHNPDVIREALAEHKIVAAITSDLVNGEVNGEKQSGNHVRYVSRVDEKGNIYVMDPNHATENECERYTPEEFYNKFPLVEILSSEGEEEVQFDELSNRLINLVPQHILASGKKSVEGKELLQLLHSNEDLSDEIYSKYLEFISDEGGSEYSSNLLYGFLKSEFKRNYWAKTFTTSLTNKSGARSAYRLFDLYMQATNEGEDKLTFNNIIRTINNNPGKSIVTIGEGMSGIARGMVENRLSSLLPDNKFCNGLTKGIGATVEWGSKILSYPIGTATTVLSGIAEAGERIYNQGKRIVKCGAQVVESCWDGISSAVGNAYDRFCSWF